MLGVRMPALRRLAKEVVRKDNDAALLSEPPCRDSYEETLLWGIVVGAARLPLDERLAAVRTFVPCIDNWALCDYFVAGLRFADAEKPALRAFLAPYLTSADEFPARFGVVMLLWFFVDADCLDDTMHALAAIPARGYNARMAVAWALAECCLRFPERGLPFLDSCALDDWTYNKTLQKMLESKRLPAGARADIRARKRR